MFNLGEDELYYIDDNDKNYFLEMGADYYNEGIYDKAIEYYRIAAALGSKQACANLGYCYMYGRSVEKNIILATAYFKISAQSESLESIDALTKLGNIYIKGDGVEKDSKLAFSYYEKALKIIENSEYDEIEDDYPSLYFSLAIELMPDGSADTDLKKAYRYLKIAERGYEKGIDIGYSYWKKSLEKTKEMLKDNIFDDVRE